MSLTSDAIERCLEALARLVRADEALSPAFEASIETFFRGPAPNSGSVGETLLAARRHLEWFLLEATVEGAPGVVLDHLAEAYGKDAARAAAEDDEALPMEAASSAFEALLRSHTGIFEVEEVRDEGAWIRDATGFGTFALVGAPVERGVLGAGDLVVGRLYPDGDGQHLASPAAAVVRGPEVVAAIARDIEEVRARSAGKVLRISQGELEAMFFGGGAIPGVAPESPSPIRRDPLEILMGAGLGANRSKAILARLAREPRDPSRLVHGGEDALGRILDELAFETDVDLAAARVAIIQAWEALSDEPAEGAAEPTAAVEPSAAAAVDRFKEARDRGGDPAELIAALQRDLGIDEDDDGPGDVPAPDFPGVVGAMIDEMRWELGATRPDFDVEALGPLRHLATFARPIGVFEELRGADLFKFSTFWLQETRALTSDDEARGLVGALREFCEWALDAHEVDLGSEFLDALDGLETSLPRMRRANDALGEPAAATPAEDGDVGQLYEVETLGAARADEFEDSEDRLRTQGGETLRVLIDDDLRPHLEPGDRLRAEIALMGDVRVFCCYPPESRALAR